MTVKNTGNDTIKSFNVFALLHGGFNCVSNIYYQHIEPVKLAPGEMQTYRLGRAREDLYYGNQLCFECMAPNAMLETNTANNKLCKIFNDIQTKNAAVSQIKIYPNPFAYHFIVEVLDNNQNMVEIKDITGRTLMRQPFLDSKITISAPGLKSGTYIVIIYSGKNVYKQMLLKR